ncbi:phage tail protein [Hafnia alvei]|uniref:phage tail-collar fiber domain-containing protein n=1 Tax=Hafnia alvei TaxID=569 RepID=UPI0024A839A7|nr:phage tail protein [Hafnia alvei]
MAQKYKAVLTKIGAAKIAAATAGGTKINLTKMAVGDGGGTLPTPDPAQTKLIAEKHRAALNKVIVDPKHKNYLVAELVIPPEIGGFWMRELGLYDEVGALIAVSNMAESYKPLLSEGSGRAQTLRMVVIVSDMETVNLLIDSSTVLATQEYVDDKLLEHEQSRRHPDATLKEKGFTQLSSATNSTSEALASTPKAVKVVYDLANAKYTAQDASTTQKGIVQLSSATDSSSETLAATPKAVKAAYDKATEADKNAKTADDNAGKANQNANSRLAKDQNGADVPNKPKFIENLGLNDTVNKAANALPIIKKVLSVDLNTLGGYEHAGIYRQDADINATFVNHYPAYLSGTLSVTPSAYGCQQEYTTYSTSRKFMRSLSGLWNGNGPWSAWVEIYSESHKPSAHDVGSISTAAQMLSNGINQDGVSNNDLNNVKPNSTAFVYSDTLNNTSGKNLVLLDYTNQRFADYRVQLGFSYESNSRVFGRTKNGDSSNWNGMFEFYTTARKPTPSEVGAVPSTGGNVGYLGGAEYYDTKPDIQPRGSGGYDGQLYSGAPFYVQGWNWPVNEGGHYVPLVKGLSTRAGEGYPTAVSFGYLLPGNATWANPVIHAKGDNNECTWHFSIVTGEIWSSKVGGMSSQTYAQERANEAREQAKTWAYQNLVSKVQVSDVQEYIDIPYPGQTYPPAGASISAINGSTKSTGSGVSFHIDRIYFRRLQHVINGIPYNIA